MLIFTHTCHRLCTVLIWLNHVVMACLLKCFNAHFLSFQRQRVKSSEQDVSKNGSLKDFIKEQRAYFDEIDKFELQEEEVESVYELD
ncbi:hypothetical protein L6164_029794 [Bauhinia variegata]|uniref:Uncharacterized protein n=1 Tax=Bauhinia variegata TaxID=167791 RepID=A0ACB9LBP2_BAUVA|nr:hypothetical protein L6164_029794 [Bauhinia variegata]